MSNELLKGPEKRILGGILVAGAVILTHMFVVKPMNEKRAQIDAETAEIRHANDSAKKSIGRFQSMLVEYAAVSNEVSAITNNYVVRQVLGSYPMEQEIYALAGQVGFSVSGCVELGKTRTPDKPPSAAAAPKGKPTPKGKPQTPLLQHRYDRFQMEVRGTGSYKSVMDLIHQLEERNPFFSVISLDISAVQGKPESHNVNFKCEWPVDADKLPEPKKKK